MLSTFVQFCEQWIDLDPRWPKIVAVLVIILLLVGPRKIIALKKTAKDKWTIFFN